MMNIRILCLKITGNRWTDLIIKKTQTNSDLKTDFRGHLHYGETTYNDLIVDILGASAKAKHVARPSLWPCTVGKQFAMKHSKHLNQGQAIRPA